MNMKNETSIETNKQLDELHEKARLAIESAERAVESNLRKAEISDLAEGKRQWQLELQEKRLSAVEAVYELQRCCTHRNAAISGALSLVDQYSAMQSSPERLSALLEVIAAGPPELFWPSLLRNWSSCDATWPARFRLLEVLSCQCRLSNAGLYFDNPARAFFESLPSNVKVYRGCSDNRVKGLAWTTDKSIAEGFAKGHRNIPVPNPVIASAQIAKDQIFFVAVDRSESEVVLDPTKLTGLRWKSIISC
jgi:hypothetical protein